MMFNAIVHEWKFSLNPVLEYDNVSNDQGATTGGSSELLISLQIRMNISDPSLWMQKLFFCSTWPKLYHSEVEELLVVITAPEHVGALLAWGRTSIGQLCVCSEIKGDLCRDIIARKPKIVLNGFILWSSCVNAILGQNVLAGEEMPRWRTRILNIFLQRFRYLRLDTSLVNCFFFHAPYLI